MNSDIWSIIGIVVSVIVGIATYYLADRKTRRSKRHAVKEEILQRLTLALGEDNIPTYDIIKATIRSVVRKSHNFNIGYIRVSEIVDDLISQVTAAHFLDAERRKKLQVALIAILSEQAEVSGGDLVSRVDEDESEAQDVFEKNPVFDYGRFIAFSFAIMAGLISLFASLSGAYESIVMLITKIIQP